MIRKTVKQYLLFDFNRLHATIPHDLLLIKVFSGIIYFAKFSESLIYTGYLKDFQKLFTQQSMKHFVSFFKIVKLVFEQDIDNPLEIDSPIFWANSFLYLFESKDAKNLIFLVLPRASTYHRTGRLTDEVCALTMVLNCSNILGICIPRN